MWQIWYLRWKTAEYLRMSIVRARDSKKRAPAFSATEVVSDAVNAGAAISFVHLAASVVLQSYIALYFGQAPAILLKTYTSHPLHSDIYYTLLHT